MPVSHGFTVTKNLTGTPAYNSWSEFQHDSTLLSQSDLVHAIAEHIMDNWFGGTPATLKAWQDKLSGTPHADAAIQQHLSDIVQSNLRLPGDPPILVKKGPRKGLENLDHLEGLVAEHLWHMCAAESGGVLRKLLLKVLPHFVWSGSQKRRLRNVGSHRCLLLTRNSIQHAPHVTGTTGDHR